MILNEETDNMVSHIIEVLHNKPESRWWLDKRQYGTTIEWDKLVYVLYRQHVIFAENQSANLFFVEEIK